MSLLDTLDARLQPWAKKLYEVAQRAGVNPRVTSALRTFAQQQHLYEIYRSGRSKYPAAPPGRSAHEFGLAFDMIVTGAQNQVDCGILWNSWNGDYGGEEDPIHFQYPGFTPPPGPSTATIISPQPTPVYTPSTELVQARRLTDILAPVVFDQLGYIVDKDAIVRAIVSAVGTEAGPDVHVALGVLAWGIEHPEEFLGTFWDAMRSALLSYL